MGRRMAIFAAAVGCAATLGAGLPGAAAAWVIQPTPNVAGVADNELVSVSCPGVTCVAVGEYRLTNGHDRPLVEAWTGSRWIIRRPAPPPGNSSTFRSVSCPAPGDCIAVGADNTVPSADVPLAEIWNGTQWSLMSIPAPPGSSSLSGVSCAAPDACTAVGFDANGSAGVPFAERWDGSSWALQPVPAPPGGSSGFNGVSCPATTTCFAVGSGTSPATGITDPLAEKWDGTRWTIQFTPVPPQSNIAFLEGIDCRGTGGCTSAGTYFRQDNGNELIMIERLRGGRWGVQSSPNPQGYTMNFLQSVSCAAAAGCTVAGTAENGSKSVTLVLQRHRGAWVIQPTPNPATGNPSLTGLSCGPAGGCTAVGNTILPGDAGTLTTLAEHR
jgi:hypothetical protein